MRLSACTAHVGNRIMEKLRVEKQNKTVEVRVLSDYTE